MFETTNQIGILFVAQGISCSMLSQRESRQHIQNLQRSYINGLNPHDLP